MKDILSNMLIYSFPISARFSGLTTSLLKTKEVFYWCIYIDI